MPAIFEFPNEQLPIENDLLLATHVAHELNGVGEFQIADEVRGAANSGNTVTIEVTPDNARMILRALDHVRAREVLDEDGKRLRDALVGDFVASPSYRLVTADGKPLGDWHPTSGPYVPGERLVTGPNDAWEVIDVTQPWDDDEMGELVVRPYPTQV